MAEQKRLFTGLQPSGKLHIGNYFGALKPTVDLFKDHEGLIMIADYHSLTSLRDGKALKENIVDVVADYLAAGIDPTKAVIFKQSDVQEHTELAWIFDCLVTVPTLMRAHAFKAKVAQIHEKWAKNKNVEILSDQYFEATSKEDPRFDAQVERMYSGINAGLFTYPMLMAADILLYDTDIVPVGEDQRQHVEYAREAAAKFNLAYGQTFKEPQEMIQKAIAVVPGTDGKKMSKSYGNTIPLFAPKEEIAKAVMSIVTDSNSNEMSGLANSGITEGSFLRPINLFRIHSLFKTKEELLDLYGNNQNNYKALKEALIEDIDAYFAPMREKRAALTHEAVIQVLKDGAELARVQAKKKMAEVREKVGVGLY